MMMNTKRARPRRSGLAGRWTLLIALAVSLAAAAGARAAGGASAEPWKASDLIEIGDFAARLSPAGEKPVIVYVGFDFLYRSGHIPGALYFGAGRNEEALAALAKWARTAPRGKTVVMYCGCCPWSECPNIRPAFKVLRAAGVKNLKLLRIPNSLLRDWISLGHPIEKGS